MANITPGQTLTTFTGDITDGSNQILSPSASLISYQYYQISITGPTGSIPPDTIINGFITGPTGIVMNNNATSNGTATFSVIAPPIQREDVDFVAKARSSTANKYIGWT